MLVRDALGRGSNFGALVVWASVGLALSACGWRTALDTTFDGGASTDAPPTSDMGGRDMAVPDMGGRDLGPDAPPPIDMSVDSPRCNFNGDCDDFIFCNGAEICNMGSCISGAPPSCSDGVSCTRDICESSVDACVNTPDNSLCTGGICNASTGCVVIPCMLSSECDDGLACNGTETCTDNICTGGAPPCGVSSSCMSVTCSESVGMPICGVAQRDADFDGFSPTMCGGGDCNDSNGLIFPGQTENCSDGIDNDCNALADCADAACSGSSSCMATTCPAAALGSAVGDNVASGNTSSRGRQFTAGCVASSRDARDTTYSWTAPETGLYVFETTGSEFDTVLSIRTSCRGAELECDDDSGGGGATSRVMHSFTAGESVIIVIDGFSEDSAGDYVLSIRSSMAGLEAGHCHDGVDNDSNGFTDCADFACRTDMGCCMGPGCGCSPSETSCRNGRDEDCDGLTDCEDTADCCGRFGCGMSPFCIVDAGVDLGVDASVDAGVDASVDGGEMDAGEDGGMMCLPRENSVALCTDGADDDCDTRVDCADTDCRPFGAGSECCNGIDDDGDGSTDLFTCRCSDDSECVGVGDVDQVCWVTAFSVCAPRCNFFGGTSFCDSVLGDGFVCNTMTGECVPE